MNAPAGRRARVAAIATGTAAAVAAAALFVVDVSHFYFLSDDAFISFRYANHVAQGLGPVWNAGEHVEGYTNFLWTMLMAGGLSLGWAPETLSNQLGIASGAALLIALVVFTAQRRGWWDPLLWFAPLVLAASRSFTAWCTGGLETMFFSLLVFLAHWAFLRERERGAATPWGSSVLYGLASLTRPEGVAFAAVAGGFFAIEIARGRRVWRAGVAWALPFAAIVGAHLLWRHAYYGMWLPNTFYAKVPGTWWRQGAYYLALFHEDYRIAWFLPLLLPSLLWRRDAVTALFGATLGVYLLCVTAVGGGRFEFRFLVPVLPYLYWLMGDSLALGLALARRGWPRALTAAAVAGVTAALLAATWVGSRRPESIYLRHGVTSVQAVKQYASWRAAEGKLLRSLIDDGLLPRDVTIAVTGAGALPYYTDWTTVDCHGLNDRTIAQLPIHHRGVIAHERTAPWDYLVKREVAVFDVLNRIVHPSDLARVETPSVEYDGRRLPVRMARVRGHTLLFATTLDDAALARALPGLDID